MQHEEGNRGKKLWVDEQANNNVAKNVDTIEMEIDRSAEFQKEGHIEGRLWSDETDNHMDDMVEDSQPLHSEGMTGSQHPGGRELGLKRKKDQPG
ncbi:hypothetical protein R1flu_006509 [Riccia fluitans]|uniref:Uncharacterized protein n=1 Tax=Riccia fluitans TaxID=41844 RepID=A0ABD1YW79_9MARC